jgi:hypothetical protein
MDIEVNSRWLRRDRYRGEQVYIVAHANGTFVLYFAPFICDPHDGQSSMIHVCYRDVWEKSMERTKR